MLYLFSLQFISEVWSLLSKSSRRYTSSESLNLNPEGECFIFMKSAFSTLFSYSCMYWKNMKELVQLLQVKIILPCLLLFHMYSRYLKCSISTDFCRQINPEVMDFTNTYLQYYLRTSTWKFLLILRKFLQFWADSDLVIIPKTIRILQFGCKMLLQNRVWRVFLFMQSPQTLLMKELIPSKILSALLFLFFP